MQAAYVAEISFAAKDKTRLLAQVINAFSFSPEIGKEMDGRGYKRTLYLV